MQRSAAQTGIAREFKDIFEVGGVPAFNQFYNLGIFVWKLLYRGFYKPWHLIPAPTISNPNATRQVYRMNAAKAVCAELASLVWGEECAVSVSMDGRESTEENPDPLDGFVQHVLRENSFCEKMQESIEEACALGGNAIKTWREVRRDSNGNEVSYISDKKQYVTHTEVTGSSKLGGFVDTVLADGGVVTKWVGGE